MHDLCAGKQSPPAGVLGGSQCDCDGHCGKRKPAPDPQLDCIFDALKQPQLDC
jgi:hypothetical protein